MGKVATESGPLDERRAMLPWADERLRLATEAASLGLWEWDILNGVVSWSPGLDAIHGIPTGSFPGTFDAWKRDIHPDDVDRVLTAVRQGVETRNGHHIEYRIIRLTDGVMRWLEARSRVLCDDLGHPVRVLGVCTDITERKATEEALRVANLQLAEAARRKDEFLAVLSHELRNPLTPIRNSLYLLEHPQADGDQHRRALAIIGRQVNHLARLVDDLLDVTRITQRKIRLQRQRLDLVGVVGKTVEDHRSLFDENREVVVELPTSAVWVDGDLTRLAQIIGNLLNNAAKFTPGGGRIIVSLTQAEPHAVLEVADTGVGIDADTLARIFEPFAQADSSIDRSRGGLGLGLALVKGMVELHGGQVAAHSDGPGCGTRFTIRLPLEARRAATLRSQPADDVDKTVRRVLIIEDNQDAAESLLEALALEGHQVAVAHDGKAGLAKARDFKPQVILCDIGLPNDLDGYQVARALRLEPCLAGAFLVALTGYVQPDDQQKAREAGFDAHIAKPPEMADLRRLVAVGAR